MKKTIFAICGKEDHYVERLTEHFKRKQGNPFEFLAFTDENTFRLYAQQNKIAFLLIECEAADRSTLENFDGCVALLSEEALPSELLQYPVICKYQSCDRIFEQMIKIYTEYGNPEKDTEKKFHVLKRETEVFTVYSPVRRCGKTGFALTLGQILAEEYPTLYLNLEPIAEFGDKTKREEQGDISDLIYLFRQGSCNFLYQLGAMAGKIRKLDYIPPGIGWDLERVQAEEWIRFVQEIIENSTYEVIVLDLDESVGDLPQILDFSKRIYMPFLEEETALEKVKRYEEMMYRGRNTKILEKTEKIVLPFFKERDTDTLLFGEMGQFIRGMLENGR